jgi:hypothetical protein
MSNKFLTCLYGIMRSIYRFGFRFGFLYCIPSKPNPISSHTLGRLVSPDPGNGAGVGVGVCRWCYLVRVIFGGLGRFIPSELKPVRAWVSVRLGARLKPVRLKPVRAWVSVRLGSGLKPVQASSRFGFGSR